MNKPKIILSNGTSFNLDDIEEPKVFGYQIVHVQTGRIIPGCNRKDYYSHAAGLRKMHQVLSMYNVMEASLNIWDYDLKPTYEHDKPTMFEYHADIHDNLIE